MNTKYIYFFVLLILILLGVWFLIDYFKNKSAMPDNPSRVLTVAATIHPLGDIVKKIGGDKIRVITILPAGASPHTFEPKPSDIKNLQTVEAIFVIGHGLDAWSKKLINSVPSVEAYQVDKGIALGKLSFEHHQEEESSKDAQDYDHEHEEGTDPHYWLSPNNGKIIAENVYETLVGLDPVNQSYYLSRLGLLKDELTSLISEAEQKLSPLTNRNLILFHESFNYLANDFNLRVVGVF
ncbi:MAG: metal ABC transporter substrate-binding protein, partial [Patescibacteria group bacterium]